MKNNNFSVSLALNAWLMSRNTFIPMSSHAVSLSADIEHALVQKKFLSRYLFYETLFNSYLLLFLTTFLWNFIVSRLM